MIAREWQARTAGPEATERYRRVFETEVLDELRAVPGFRGAYLLARSPGGPAEIRTLTLFDGHDAVRPSPVTRPDVSGSPPRLAPPCSTPTRTSATSRS